MKSLLDTINLCSEEWRGLKEEEFEELNRNRDYKELNETHFKNRTLFVNHEGDDFYHYLEIMPKEKRSLWIQEVVNEMLKSPNSKEFIKAIKKKVGDDYVGDYTEDYDVAGFVRIKVYNLDKHLNEVLEICKFFRYYISDVIDDIILFEPVLTQEVTKEIKNKYNNKVYHLAREECIDSIKKNGLIVSGATGRDIDDPIWYMSSSDMMMSKHNNTGDSIRKKIQKFITYRIFPNRVFVFYTDIDPVVAAFHVADTIGRQLKDYSLVEVDLGRHNIPFFRDRAMREHRDVRYAYSNIDIPPKLISNIIEL